MWQKDSNPAPQDLLVSRCDCLAKRQPQLLITFKLIIKHMHRLNYKDVYLRSACSLEKEFGPDFVLLLRIQLAVER